MPDGLQEARDVLHRLAARTFGWDLKIGRRLMHLEVVHRPLVVLQPTTFCNIDCQYCYLPDRSKTKRMSISVIRRIAAEVFGSNLFDGEIAFLWHLGEPLSVPPDFYEEAFSEIARISLEYNRSHAHVFQTN